MFVNIKYMQCIRRIFACMFSLYVYCFLGIAPCAAGMFYAMRMVSRASFCPRAEVPPIAKASTNTRLALLGRYDGEECSLHAYVPFRACRSTKITRTNTLFFEAYSVL